MNRALNAELVSPEQLSCLMILSLSEACSFKVNYGKLLLEL